MICTRHPPKTHHREAVLEPFWMACCRGLHQPFLVRGSDVATVDAQCRQPFTHEVMNVLLSMLLSCVALGYRTDGQKSWKRGGSWAVARLADADADPCGSDGLTS